MIRSEEIIEDILAVPGRRNIIKLLYDAKKPLCVSEITDRLNNKYIENISRNLSLLKRYNIVRKSRDGKFVYYTINEDSIEGKKTIELLKKIYD